MKITRARQAREPRRDSRGAVMEAAQRLFLQRGFGAVSMDDLAQAAAVARRTLYNQFASKEEIFRAMLQHVSAPPLRSRTNENPY